MQESTEQETQLVTQLRNNVSDLSLPKHQLETKNLLRFIRARGRSLKNAESMFRRQVEWREGYDVDNLLSWQYPIEFKSNWPWALTGFDNMDGPVLIIPIGEWDPTKVPGNYDDFVKYCIACIESVWRMMQQKSVGQKTMKQFCVILDLKGLGFRHVSNFDAMHGILEVVKAFEANYPETMRLGLIINAPYVFEIAWRLIKPFVSEATHAKLRFLGSDATNWKEELLKVMKEDQFPKKYGGTLSDSYEISVEAPCTKLKGANSNDYICENLMRAERTA